MSSDIAMYELEDNGGKRDQTMEVPIKKELDEDTDAQMDEDPDQDSDAHYDDSPDSMDYVSENDFEIDTEDEAEYDAHLNFQVTHDNNLAKKTSFRPMKNTGKSMPQQMRG